MTATDKPDNYTRVTNCILADLEHGARPWFKPWSSEHATGRIIRSFGGSLICRGAACLP